MCTRAKDTDCANQAINETVLIEELGGLLETIDLDEIGMRAKIEEEVARYNKFRVGVLGMKTKDRNSAIEVRNYAKYLLKEGTITEKRELLSCLKSALVLKDKKVSLQ